MERTILLLENYISKLSEKVNLPKKKKSNSYRACETIKKGRERISTPFYFVNINNSVVKFMTKGHVQLSPCLLSKIIICYQLKSRQNKLQNSAKIRRSVRFHPDENK